MDQVLDLDLGNTRLKWRYSNGHAQTEGALNNSNLYADEALPNVPVERIRIASVAAEAVLEPVIEACRKRWKVEPEIAVVRESCAGVKQGYRDLNRLGVDRWLILLAAYSRIRHPCVVVSCGTAVTIDLVTAAGEHLGGYIVPGLELMRTALFSGTHAVKLEQLSLEGRLAPGRDTQEAVSRGLFLMVGGVINDAITTLSTAGEIPMVIFTGGDGERLLPLLSANTSIDVQYLPNLVLDGLALALP